MLCCKESLSKIQTSLSDIWREVPYYLFLKETASNQGFSYTISTCSIRGRKPGDTTALWSWLQMGSPSERSRGLHITQLENRLHFVIDIKQEFGPSLLPMHHLAHWSRKNTQCFYRNAAGQGDSKTSNNRSLISLRYVEVNSQLQDPPRNVRHP